jgi:hypothetical protein
MRTEQERERKLYSRSSQLLNYDLVDIIELESLL